MADAFDTIAPDVDIEAELAREDDGAIDMPAPIVAETPEPKPPEPEKVEVQPPPVEKPPPGYVKLEALHEARARIKELDRQSAEKLAALEAKLNALTNPPPAVPKFEDDPANNLRLELEKTKQELGPVKEELAQTRQQREIAALEARLTRDVETHEAEYIKENPDYLQAVEHIRKVTDSNLALRGVTDPAARAAAFRRDAMALSLQALQDGKNPAELFYAMAKNMGYTKGAPKADGAAKLANIEKGQKATPGMPGGGGAKIGAISIEDIGNLDDAEVDALIADDANWKKLIRA